jgi:hypothetical protein
MASPATPTPTLALALNGIARKTRREESNRVICDFVGAHSGSFLTSDVKNGQGLLTTYTLHKLMEQSPDSEGFTLYEIADYIRENELWFKPSIKEVNGVFSVGNGSLNPYINEIDGVKRATMYVEDRVMSSGNSQNSIFILEKLRGNVISHTRAHNLIRRLVDRSGQETYRVHFPRYLPPSNLNTGTAAELNRAMRPSGMSQRDQDFFDCW